MGFAKGFRRGHHFLKGLAFKGFASGLAKACKHLLDGRFMRHAIKSNMFSFISRTD